MEEVVHLVQPRADGFGIARGRLCSIRAGKQAPELTNSHPLANVRGMCCLVEQTRVSV
jgi:hypothetical protein